MKQLSLDIHHTRFSENHSTVYKHAIVWLVFIVYEVSLLTVIAGGRPHVLDLLLHYPLYITLFYYHCYRVLNVGVKDEESDWRRLILHVLAELITFFIIGAIISFYLQNLGIRPKWSVGNYTFIYGNIYRCIYILGASTGFWFALFSIRKQKRIIQMNHDKAMAILEKENTKLRSEAALQKATINPHMLFNKLTFLYGQVKKVDKASAANILSVAELMHFALLDNAREEGIRLKDELRYIEHYIRLHKQRFASNIILRKEGTASDFRQLVIPLLLITLVENLLQHGDLSEPALPALVRVSCKENVLDIGTQNLIGFRSGTGHRIGLANLEKRLGHAYPGSFRYSSHIENDIYKCTLKIHLNKSPIC